MRAQSRCTKYHVRVYVWGESSFIAYSNSTSDRFWPKILNIGGSTGCAGCAKKHPNVQKNNELIT